MWRACLLYIVLAGCRSEQGFGVGLPGVTGPTDEELNLPPGEHEDRFLQAIVPESDVLFVVDNSNSMQGEQAQLAQNFPRFLDWFLDSGIDYHIGVVSTDMYDRDHAGLLRASEGYRWIDANTRAPRARFSDMASLGTDGANDERGRAAAYTAIELRGDLENQGFVRREASLHLVVVSDEEDGSGSQPISLGEFTNYLDSLRREPQAVTFSSIVGLDDPDASLLCNVEPGLEYLEITRAVGGVEWSICDANWGPVLDELGILAAGLTRDFFLSQKPVVDTLKVSVHEGKAVQEYPYPSEAWSYDELENRVSFVDLPPAGAEIRVHYTVEAVENTAP